MTYDIGTLVRRATADPGPARRTYSAIRARFGRETASPGDSGDPAFATGMERMFASPAGDRAVQAVGNEGLTLSIIGDLAVEALLGTLDLGGVRGAPGIVRQQNGVQTLVVKSRIGIGASPTVLLLDPDLEGDGTIRLTGELDVAASPSPLQFVAMIREMAAGRFGSAEHRKVAQIVLDQGQIGLTQILWIAQPEVLL